MQRRKTASLAAAGFLVAAAAFAGGQQPAGASEDEQQVTISYVSYGSEMLTCTLHPAPCTLHANTTHDTDDPDHPALRVGGFVSGPMIGRPTACRDTFSIEVDATYDDQQGQPRSFTTTAFASLGAEVDGAYSAIHATYTVNYFNCDPSRSATCTATVTTAPK